MAGTARTAAYAVDPAKTAQRRAKSPNSGWSVNFCEG